jgi:hypothetical protein
MIGQALSIGKEGWTQLTEALKSTLREFNSNFELE